GRVRPTGRPPRDSPPTGRTAAPGPRHGGGPGRTTDPVPPGHPPRPGLPAYRNHLEPDRPLLDPPPGQVRRVPSLTRPIAPPQHDDVQVGCRLGWKTEQYARSHDDGALGRAVRSSVGLPESQGHEPGHATIEPSVSALTNLTSQREALFRTSCEAPSGLVGHGREGLRA